MGKLCGWGHWGSGAWCPPRTDRATPPAWQPCMEGPARIGSPPPLPGLMARGQRGRQPLESAPASPQGSRASCSQPHPVPSLQGPRTRLLLLTVHPVSAAWPARLLSVCPTCPVKQTQAAGLGARVRELTSPFSANLHEFQALGLPRSGGSSSASPTHWALPCPSGLPSVVSDHSHTITSLILTTGQCFPRAAMLSAYHSHSSSPRDPRGGSTITTLMLDRGTAMLSNSPNVKE